MAGKKNSNSKSNKKNNESIQILLLRAYDSQNDEKALEFIEKILALDPENPEALMLKADKTENDNEKLKLINLALKELKKDSRNSDENELLTCALQQRLAFIYFSQKKYDDVLKITRNISDLNSNGFFDSEHSIMLRALHYRTLIELRKWSEILSETMRDEIHDSAWAYSRLLAAFILSSKNSIENNRTCSRMFCEALKIDPEVPFFMLGYRDEPDDEEDLYNNPLIELSFNFALMFYDTLNISGEFSTWFSKGTMLFGLFTNRFGREYEFVIDAIDSIGGYNEYEVLSTNMFESDDEAVLEMMASKGFPLR